MEIIRRNTDYALRILLEMVNSFDQKQPISAKHLSTILHIPYPITCKLLQKLQDHKITTSIMGPKGGYILFRSPSQITFLEVIETIQGPLHINRCFLETFRCPLKERCPLHKKLGKIQEDIILSLKQTTLEEFGTKGQSKTGS